MKPGPAISAPVTSGERGEARRDQLGQRARIGAGRLGQHHRGIGGEIAMRRIARRLDRDGAARQPGRQLALGLEGVEQRHRDARRSGRRASRPVPVQKGSVALDDARGELKRGRVAIGHGKVRQR